MSWLHQASPEQQEQLIAEIIQQFSTISIEQTPVDIDGRPGVMLAPVPGEVANSVVYVSTVERLYTIRYFKDTLDDLGRCLLDTVRFYPPSQSLEELQLTLAGDALYPPPEIETAVAQTEVAAAATVVAQATTRTLAPVVQLSTPTATVALASPTPPPVPAPMTATTTAESPSWPSPPLLLFYAVDGHLYRTDIAGTFPQQLTTTPREDPADPDVALALLVYRPPRVSPDGKWLALNGGWGGAAVLDWGNQRALGVGRGRAMRSPTWSPDSQSFAYVTTDRQLCLFHLSQQSVSCPFQSERDLLGASWSPDGTYIAVVTRSPDCCEGQVWLYHTVTAQATVVASITLPLETAVGELLAWLNGGRGLLINTPETAAVYFPASNTIEPLPEPVIDFSPDGRYFLHRSGEISHGTGGQSHPLPHNSAACQGETQSLATSTWSANGQWLAYTTLCQANGDVRDQWLHVMDVETNELLWQQALAPEFSLREWMPGGDFLLLSHQTSGFPQDTSLWRITAAGPSDPQMIIEQGLFVSTVPQWHE